MHVYSNNKTLFKELNKAHKISIDKKMYKELCNIVYELEYKSTQLKKNIEPHMYEDFLERVYLMGRLDRCIEFLKEDEHSRRAVFSNLYENQMGRCIVAVHTFIRDDKVHINEYYRSQEASRNFQYDYQTACLLMDKLTKQLNKKVGKITVMVMSFHKEING